MKFTPLNILIRTKYAKKNIQGLAFTDIPEIQERPKSKITKVTFNPNI